MIKNLKKYSVYILLAFALLALVLATNKKDAENETRTAEYRRTGDNQSVIESAAVDKTLGEVINTVEENNTFLEHTDKEGIGRGYTEYNYTDTEKMAPVKLITNERSVVVAIYRSPITEYEKNINSLKEQLDLGTPEAVMYPKGSIVGMVFVYPEKGVAIRFEDYTGSVSKIAVFEPMPLTQFKHVFSTLFQDNFDENAY